MKTPADTYYYPGFSRGSPAFRRQLHKMVVELRKLNGALSLPDAAKKLFMPLKVLEEGVRFGMVAVVDLDGEPYLERSEVERLSLTRKALKNRWLPFLSTKRPMRSRSAAGGSR